MAVTGDTVVEGGRVVSYRTLGRGSTPAQLWSVFLSFSSFSLLVCKKDHRKTTTGPDTDETFAQCKSELAHWRLSVRLISFVIGKFRAMQWL